jgi:hypothetical protein
LDFVLGLHCGFGFVWLLLWLWMRFFNMVVACVPLVVALKAKHKSSIILFSLKEENMSGTKMDQSVLGWFSCLGFGFLAGYVYKCRRMSGKGRLF